MHKALKGMLWAGAAVAVPATVNAIISRRTARLQGSLPGDIAYYDWIFGRVAFYRLGQGPPLLLVHHPNPGGSAWEWRKVFPELANSFTVYAIDLLGFGLSDKPNIDYSGALLADLVNDFISDVIDARPDAIGSGLGAAYLVNVAVRRPESLARLVLANPTGTTMTMPAYAEYLTWTAFHLPVLGTSAYFALMTMGGLERELKEHIYADPTMVTTEMVEQLYTAAHQPGSQYAAAAYLSGRLDLPMRLAFADLEHPTLLAWGRDAYYTPLTDAADLLYRSPQAKLEILNDCGMLPHDEKAGEFIRLARGFLPEISQGEIAA
ncbi:MAG: alpha/beta fold hydrolase [Armatimonadota bacterium]